MKYIIIMLAVLLVILGSSAYSYPNLSGWNEMNVQGIRSTSPPAPHNGSYYLDMVIDNSYDKDEAYLTQTVPISPIGQQQIYVRVYRPSDTASGINPYFEFSDNAGGLLELYVPTPQAETWTENWWLVTPADGATEFTVRIKLSRLQIPGTRHFYIDNLDFDTIDIENQDFEAVDGLTIIESGGSTDVNEEGSTSDTYTIALSAGPPSSRNVRVSVDPDNQTKVNGNTPGMPIELTFDSGNWSIPQEVNVTAVDDITEEGFHTSIITHYGTSNDPNYSGLIGRNVTVYITDNDDIVRSCYGINDTAQPDDIFGFTDFALVAEQWLKPYDGSLWQKRPVPFRAMLSGAGGWPRGNPHYTDLVAWDSQFSEWASEGYNAVIWTLGSEVFNGSNRFLFMNDFPEAREYSIAQIQANQNDLKDLLALGKSYGIKQFFYTLELYYTNAFKTAHGLGDHERNGLTRALRESVFAEMSRTFLDLDGYYGDMGETLPGKRSSWFGEAIAPGLQCTGGRENNAPKPLFIAIQWQIPIEEYIEDIVPESVYDNTWLAYHGYNSEQITDAAPWPSVVNWAKRTGLPTVVELYPTNIYNFPFNSPKFAAEIANEIKLIPNIKGFLYAEWTSGKLSPLFRKALGYYSSSSEDYDDEPWLQILENQFGNRTAAEHFLKAFNISGRLIPEKDALVYCGHGPGGSDGRELQISYELFKTDWKPFSYLTSRVHSRPLVPVWLYAKYVAKNSAYYENKDGSENMTGQNSIWVSEGGSEFDVIPPDQMSKVAQMGQDAYDEATLGLSAATQNLTEAQNAWMFMKGYKLVSAYYESKVNAATAAYIAYYTGLQADKDTAQILADVAFSDWMDFYNFVVTENPNLNSVMQSIYGVDVQELMGGAPKTMQTLLNEETYDKDNLAIIFNW